METHQPQGARVIVSNSDAEALINSELKPSSDPNGATGSSSVLVGVLLLAIAIGSVTLVLANSGGL